MSTSKKTSPTSPAQLGTDTPNHRFEGIRYAQTPAGLLAQGDAEALRRYVLTAPNEEAQVLRQTALLEESTSKLALWDVSPSIGIGASSQVANVALYGWPVLLTTAETLQVRDGFYFDSPDLKELVQKMSRIWGQALGIAPSAVRIQGGIKAQLLSGASPLQLQKTLDLSCKALQITSADQSRRTQEPWSSWYSNTNSVQTTVGPDRPIVFLLIALVAIEIGEEFPRHETSADAATLAMRDVLQALFAHTEAARSDPIKKSMVKVSPTIRMGQVMRLPDAITAGQAMELGWLAERSRKTDAQIQVELTTCGDVIHWSAKLTDQYEQLRTNIEYSYDGFWRPVTHLREIQRQLAMAQGTGSLEAGMMRLPLLH